MQLSCSATDTQCAGTQDSVLCMKIYWVMSKNFTKEYFVNWFSELLTMIKASGHWQIRQQYICIDFIPDIQPYLTCYKRN